MSVIKAQEKSLISIGIQTQKGPSWSVSNSACRAHVVVNHCGKLVGRSVPVYDLGVIANQPTAVPLNNVPSLPNGLFRSATGRLSEWINFCADLAGLIFSGKVVVSYMKLKFLTPHFPFGSHHPSQDGKEGEAGPRKSSKNEKKRRRRKRSRLGSRTVLTFWRSSRYDWLLGCFWMWIYVLTHRSFWFCVYHLCTEMGVRACVCVWPRNTYLSHRAKWYYVDHHVGSLDEFCPGALRSKTQNSHASHFAQTLD